MKEVYYYSQAKLRTQARLMLIKLKGELSHIWCVCTRKFSKKTLGGGVLVSHGRNPLTRRDLGARVEIS